MANLLGRFVGDPTHPAVMYVPMALYPAALLFDALAYVTHDGSLYTHGAFVLLYGGWLGGHMVFTHGASVEPQGGVADYQAERDATSYSQAETTT
jgi:uncharacterized membrane protein